MKIKLTRVRKKGRKSARGNETMVCLSGLIMNVLFDFLVMKDRRYWSAGGEKCQQRQLLTVMIVFQQRSSYRANEVVVI